MNIIKNLFSLHLGEESPQKVRENILGGISFRGANLWILACAILIASIGLNVNSTAVIIGAMLISPLMGPIVGSGYALATYDIDLLRRSIKNLLIATFVGLIVSCFYFYLSPFKEVQSELLARTSPTIYDVMIAFFGGIVGVISMTRVEKGNPIPGVAIATALMPPLCTAGFGLATFNFKFIAGALYLYCINCFFIAISTFLIIKYLKYRPVTTENKAFDKKVKMSIYVLIFLMIVPSSYLAYSLLKEKEYHQRVENFLKQEFQDGGYTIIYKKVDYNSNPRKIELAVLSKEFDEEEIKSLNQKLEGRGIENTHLIMKQSNTDLKAEILSELNRRENNLSEKDVQINALANELNIYKIGSHQLDKEAKTIFPEIKEITFATATNYAKKEVNRYPVVIYQSEKPIDKDRLEQWLKVQFNSNNIMVLEKK